MSRVVLVYYIAMPRELHVVNTTLYNTVMTRKSTREKHPTEKVVASHSSSSKGKGVARSRESKTKVSKATSRKGGKRRLSTSGEDSDESRMRESEENLTSKKAKKRSRIYVSSDNDAIPEDEPILDDADDKVEGLSQLNIGDGESSVDENASERDVCVSVDEI